MNGHCGLALIAVAGLLACNRAPSKPSIEGIACVDRLTIPAYPSIASSARVALHGLTVSVQLAANGEVQTVSFEGPSDRTGVIARQLFERFVEASLRASTFRKECGGQVVTIGFDFRLSEQWSDNGRVSFLPPNRFEVQIRFRSPTRIPRNIETTTLGTVAVPESPRAHLQSRPEGNRQNRVIQLVGAGAAGKTTFARPAEREEHVIRERFSTYFELRARKVETMQPIEAVVAELVAALAAQQAAHPIQIPIAGLKACATPIPKML